MTLESPKINATFDRKFGNLHYTDDVCILCSVNHFGRVFSFPKAGLKIKLTSGGEESEDEERRENFASSTLNLQPSKIE